MSTPIKNDDDIIPCGTLCTASKEWVFIVVGLINNNLSSKSPVLEMITGMRSYVCLYNDGLVDTCVVQVYNDSTQCWELTNSVRFI